MSLTNVLAFLGGMTIESNESMSDMNNKKRAEITSGYNINPEPRVILDRYEPRIRSIVYRTEEIKIFKVEEYALSEKINEIEMKREKLRLK